jgi:adenylate cyclase
MGVEIERKFLVTGDGWRKDAVRSEHIIQGYLANTERGSIRVRIAGERAGINIKSMTLGVSRREFDYPVPVADAEALLELCMQPLIEKTRHYVPCGAHTFEVDEFEGANAGLVVAELELSHADEAFVRPPWLGEDVSHEPRYYNVCLVTHPYSAWTSRPSGT